MNWVSVSIVRAQGAWVFSNRIWTFIKNRFCDYLGLCSLDFHLEDDILHSQSKNIYGYGYQFLKIVNGSLQPISSQEAVEPYLSTPGAS